MPPGRMRNSSTVAITTPGSTIYLLTFRPDPLALAGSISHSPAALTPSPMASITRICRNALIFTPMIEKIVQAAKQTVKAKVLNDRALN